MSCSPQKKADARAQPGFTEYLLKKLFSSSFTLASLVQEFVRSLLNDLDLRNSACKMARGKDRDDDGPSKNQLRGLSYNHNLPAFLRNAQTALSGG